MLYVAAILFSVSIALIHYLVGAHPILNSALEDLLTDTPLKSYLCSLKPEEANSKHISDDSESVITSFPTDSCLSDDVFSHNLPWNKEHTDTKHSKPVTYQGGLVSPSKVLTSSKLTTPYMSPSLSKRPASLIIRNSPKRSLSSFTVTPDPDFASCYATSSSDFLRRSNDLEGSSFVSPARQSNPLIGIDLDYSTNCPKFSAPQNSLCLISTTATQNDLDMDYSISKFRKPDLLQRFLSFGSARYIRPPSVSSLKALHNTFPTEPIMSSKSELENFLRKRLLQSSVCCSLYYFRKYSF